MSPPDDKAAVPRRTQPFSAGRSFREVSFTSADAYTQSGLSPRGDGSSELDYSSFNHASKEKGITKAEAAR